MAWASKEQARLYNQKWRAENPERYVLHRTSPKRRYGMHRSNARERGVAWELSFDQWWSLWAPYWDKRGPKRGQFVMSRFMDTGPYAAHNVRIVPAEDNIAEANYLQGRRPPPGSGAEGMKRKAREKRAKICFLAA